MKRLLIFGMLALFAQQAFAHYLTAQLPSGDFLVLNSAKTCERQFGVSLKRYGFLMGPGKQVNVCWDYMSSNKNVKVFYSTGMYVVYPVKMFKNSSKLEQHYLGD